MDDLGDRLAEQSEHGAAGAALHVVWIDAEFGLSESNVARCHELLVLQRAPRVPARKGGN
jgi:hypothetical protein